VDAVLQMVVLLVMEVVDRSMITNETLGGVRTARSGELRSGLSEMGPREKGHFVTTVGIFTSVMANFLSGPKTCIREILEQWIIDNHS